MSNNKNIYHYINLVGWDRIFCDLMSHNQLIDCKSIFYCDTFSLKILSYFFGNKVDIISGPSVLECIYNYENVLYLTAYKSKLNEIVLPQFIDSASIDKYVFDLELPSNLTCIVIGISSPTQNYLALKIAEKINYSCDIHCLGAAIYLDNDKINSNFYWFRFMLSSPLRTINKTWVTIKEFLSILFSKEKRVSFKLFSNNIEKSKKRVI